VNNYNYYCLENKLDPPAQWQRVAWNNKIISKVHNSSINML